MSMETIEHRYTSMSGDEPIVLFSGQLKLTWDGQSFEGAGEIRFDWRPYQRIYFKVLVPNELGLLHINPTDSVLVEINGGEGKGSGHVWGSQISGPSLVNEMFGSIEGHFVVGNPAATDIVRFHLPNFPNYVGAVTTLGGDVSASRLVARTERWQIDIDAVSDAFDIYSTLTTTAGFGITNVGIARKVDGSAVRFEDVERLLPALYWWLSLLRGERTGPMLLSGEHEGKVVWEIWNAPNVARWSGRNSWLPVNLVNIPGDIPDTTSPVFDYLMSSPPEERAAIVRVISWYTQSIENSYLETTVILAQAGLELIAWLKLIEVGIDEGTINSWNAADEFRLVLTFANIPLDIPPKLTQLLSGARGMSASDTLDGPGSVASIRNGAVHPKASSRFMDDQAKLEGSILAIRYLELLILNRCRYLGTLKDRTDFMADESPVPWTQVPQGDPTAWRRRAKLESA
ncbi:MAG: hypothetical protein ACHQFZ_04275 [Acidimicrobiales bacterium]